MATVPKFFLWNKHTRVSSAKPGGSFAGDQCHTEAATPEGRASVSAHVRQGRRRPHPAGLARPVAAGKRESGRDHESCPRLLH